MAPRAHRIGSAGPTGRQGGEPLMFLGRAKGTPSDADDPLLVIVDTFDGRFTWEAVGWVPHGTDSPSKNDHVLVARVESQTIAVAWWPR